MIVWTQLTYYGKLVLSKKLEVILKLLKEFCDFAIRRHSNFLGTYKRISLNVR